MTSKSTIHQRETKRQGIQLFDWDVLPTAPPRITKSKGKATTSENDQYGNNDVEERPGKRVTLKSALDSLGKKFPSKTEFRFPETNPPTDLDWTDLGSFRSSRFGVGTSMADNNIPLIPKVNVLEIRTGNIVNWNRLKRKPNHTPRVELTECVQETLKKVLASLDKTQLQYVKELKCVDPEVQQPLQPDERGELKVIIKVFVCSAQQQPSEVIQEAIEKSMAEMEVSFVETVLLSLSMFETEEGITVELIKPYWEALESLVEEERILSIGISDLDKRKLEELYNWAKIKPCIDQVNLASCCVMPKDLTEYAKQVDIQLQTHNDPPELLPSSQLQETIRHCGTEQDSFGWVPVWVSRYSVLIKCRGIIKSKGYILQAVRDPHRRM